MGGSWWVDLPDLDTSNTLRYTWLTRCGLGYDFGVLSGSYTTHFKTRRTLGWKKIETGSRPCSGEPPLSLCAAHILRFGVWWSTVDGRHAISTARPQRCYSDGSMSRRRPKPPRRTTADAYVEHIGGDDKTAMRLLCSAVHRNEDPGMTHD